VARLKGRMNVKKRTTDMRCNEHTGCGGPNAVRRIRDDAEFKVEQGFVQATGECISSDVDNMLGPNDSVHVIIQERADKYIFWETRRAR
jgi:hypothetical protein